MPPADSRTDAEQSAPQYAEAGVDIGANDRLIPRFKALAAEIYKAAGGAKRLK